MNRRAEIGDQLYLAYFIFILLMITGGIVLGSYLTSGKDYDIRSVDAELLGKKIISCLSEQKDLTAQKVADLYSTCSLDEKSLENGLIIEINTQTSKLFTYGNVVACGLSDKNEDYPRCLTTSVRVKLDGQDTDLYITAGSNLKSEKKNG
jgi:hypothetical protein